MNRLPGKKPRFILVLLLLCVTIFSTYARPAQAQWTVATVQDIPRTIFQFVDKVVTKIGKAFKISGDIAFKSSLEIFQARLLKEVQTNLATVGPGQKPLFLTNPKKFFKNVTNAAAGDFIDDFTHGVTGESGVGSSFSGARGKFLITRLLRAQAGQVVGGVTAQCKKDCDLNFSSDNLDTSQLSTMSPEEYKSFAAAPFRNEHEEKIWKVEYELNGPEGTRNRYNKDNAGVDDCREVEQVNNGSDIVWIISIGFINNSVKLTDCIDYQEQALNLERSTAQTETYQCLQTCQVRGTAATNAIKGFTATDIFSAVQNADPRKAPAALANALSSDKSDIGQFLSAAGALTAKIQEVVTGEQTNLNPNIFPITTKVSEEVKSPSTTASTLLGVPFVGSDGKFTYTGTSVADVLKGVLSFINSPVGKALTNYFKSKCGLNPDLCKGPSNSQSTIGQLVFGSGAPTGTAGAQLLYATLGQTQITVGDPGRNEINITDQLATGGLIDAGFRQAIEGTLTVKEALANNFLDPQKTFGFNKNGVEPRDGYFYRALQYLRKFRVIPVGWELAAKYSQRFDHRDLSLGYLVSRFNICDQDEKKLVCSVGGADCSTAASLAACSAAGGSCAGQRISSEHTVCARGTKADQSCLADIDCGLDKNGAPISCGASPYCGLVDPGWVLKAPQTYCRRQGAGEEILAKEFVCDQNNIDDTTGNIIPAGVVCASNSNVCTDILGPNCVKSDANPYPDVGRWVIERNSDTCADTQSCISENEDGSCLAFGYCVQERRAFKFEGTKCSAENSSCTAYTNIVGQQVSYLANTLDSRDCTADNAGCTQYCRAPSYDPSKQTCVGTDRINFNAKVQTCQASEVGCNQYLRMASGANLLTNNGFETWTPSTVLIDGPSPATYPGWNIVGGVGAFPVSSSDPAITGNNRASVRLVGGGTDGLTQIVPTGQELVERSFTFSIRAKSDANCSARLQLGPNSGNALLPHIPTVATDTNMNVTTSWDTYDETLTFPDASIAPGLVGLKDMRVGIQLGNCTSGQFMIDSAQLAEADSSSAYRDYASANAIYLNATRTSCLPADVGCLAYTPAAGGSVIFGQVRNSNRCSSDKVGCGTFQLEPITNVPPRIGGQLNMVAPRGELCSASEVGCEEYTNLDEVAKGGEGREYLKTVKQCVKPSQTNATNPVSATYYTWIGDAKLGFVLRAYDLVKSDVTSAPCTTLTLGTISTPPKCADAGWAAVNASCSALTLATNADCAQYYDSALVVYYRLRSKTVSITEDCHPYRNTIDQSDAALKNNIYYLSSKENEACSGAAAGCRAYTGNASGTTRKVFSDTFESNGVNNWVGGTASNASTVLSGHSMAIDVTGPSHAGVTIPSILANQIVNSRTYLLTFTAAASGAQPSVITAAFGDQVGNSFNPIPTATFPGSVTATLNNAITPAGPEWRNFTLGPLLMLQDLPTTQLGIQVAGGSAYVDNVVLTEINDHLYQIGNSAPLCSIAEVGCAAYRTKSGATEYLSSFTRLCSEQVVGCEALIDTKNSTSPFAQTVMTNPSVTTPADSIVTLVNDPANYCSAAAKGCEAVGQPTYGPDQKISGYQTKYLINNPDRHSQILCENTELSCQIFTTANNTSAYFKDPGQRLCDYRTGGDGNGQWFMTGTSLPCPVVYPPLAGRPVGPSCSPTCSVGSERAGKACISNANCPGGTCVGDVTKIGKISGDVYGQCTSDVDCLGLNKCIYLAGSCPVDQGSCTEYRDPTDPVNCRSDCPLSQTLGGSPDLVDGACQRTQCLGGKYDGHNCQNDADCTDTNPHSCIGSSGSPAEGLPGCRSYYYLSQSLQSSGSSCNGKVDIANGCRPFNDTTNPSLYFRGQ